VLVFPVAWQDVPYYFLRDEVGIAESKMMQISLSYSQASRRGGTWGVTMSLSDSGAMNVSYSVCIMV
jgi:hypothetical protein